MNRRFLLWGGLAAGVIVLILLVIVFFAASSGAARSGVGDSSRYTSRVLMIPQREFLMQDVEQDLLNPEFRLLVDPNRPLDGSVRRDVEADLIEALVRDLLPRLEGEVQDLLFE